MRPNPERLAWIVLLLSFAVFCVLVVAVPLGIRWYLLHAQREQKAVVESLVGTVVVEQPKGRALVPLSKGQTLAVGEGAIIRVDENAEAVVRFFDHSFMRLFPATTVRLDRLRSPKFRLSRLPNAVQFHLVGGAVQIGTALPLSTGLDFRVTTLQAQMLFAADGSYALEANNNRSEIVAYRGQAVVRGAGAEVRLEGRQRTWVALGQPPRPAEGIARNLVTNGDFNEPLEQSWRLFNDQGADGGNVDGRAEVVVDEGHRAVRFFRSGGYGNHCETILEQTLEKQLPDQATSLVVRATVKVRNQSLSGGGYLSSEYPLMIRIIYRDAYDSETEWVQGFYYQNRDNNPTTYGLQIPQDQWYVFESPNLLEFLPIRPYKIMRVRVYASGWDYESLISDLNLIVE